jgi:putative phosphoesterase
MKFLIASDIHGSALYVRQLLELFQKGGYDRLLLLGDLLYHGPRNDLPQGHAPKEVIQLLNACRDKILCVRGNCDGEVDQMVLDFPIMADYGLILLEKGQTIYMTHGHVYNAGHLPPLQKGDILLHGHTHIPVLEKKEDYTLLNPGSVSLPKGGHPHTCMAYESGRFTLMTLQGEEISCLRLD